MAKPSMKFPFEIIFSFFYRAVFTQRKNPKPLHRNASNVHRYPSFVHGTLNLLPDQTALVFIVEEVLLKSSSLFPYFMLVTFEAGGLLRAFILFSLYPFLCLFSEEMRLNIMVLVCFFGIKQKSFRIGASVLPKFFLEDVGLEMFEMLRKGGKKVAVSNIPQVMIESFLKDYLDVDFVVGRELKVFCGYFVGVMEEKKRSKAALNKIVGTQSLGCDVIGICGLRKSLDYQLLSHCKKIYVVRKADKRSWQKVPREEYSKPLIFHDGRLAFRPTLMATLAMFMWVPFGLTLSIFRTIVALTLPFKISIPLLSFTGLHLFLSVPVQTSTSIPYSKKHETKGRLYVCNHRTLLDPLYLSFGLQKHLTAVTYSLSRISEMLAPIKTVRLARDREQDGEMMQKMLKQGDLVVCPEGTTCRESYLLRFSPLFAEMCDDIVPVAMNTHVSLFYGTTAGGMKSLDPVFFLMNPTPIYEVKMLDAVSGFYSCLEIQSEKASFDVANNVQNEIGKALGFECTKLTRRDKYLILAGNDGIVGKA